MNLIHFFLIFFNTLFDRQGQIFEESKFMSSRSIILSSSGLKNIVINQYDEWDEFCFIIGKRKIKMNKILAEFISPAVSHLHHSDPTINSYDIEEIIHNNCDEMIEETRDEFESTVISFLEEITRGNFIEINTTGKSIHYIKILSIILENDELYELINEINRSEKGIDELLSEIGIIYKLGFYERLNKGARIICDICNHFSEIKRTRLIKLPKTILYSILSNAHLNILNDELFEIIETLDFTGEETQEDNETNEEIDRIQFYELIEFSKLSSNNFSKFVEEFEGINMTRTLWNKLIKCFYIYKDKPQEERKKEESTKDYSKGIFKYLFEEFKMNPVTKGLIEIEGNSNNDDEEQLLPNIVDSNWTSSHWASQNSANSHIKIEFKNNLIKINKYSLKIGNTSGNYVFRSWTLKGITSDEREILLDEVSENDDVVHNKGEITRNIEYQEEPPFIRSIILTMKGKEYKSNNCFMCMRNIEIYGSITI